MNDNYYDYEAEYESAAVLENLEKHEYDDKYILKKLMEGKSREEIALNLNHKNYRTLDMYMRRRGYVWDSIRQTYIIKNNFSSKESFHDSMSGKVQRIISLFSSGLDPMEVAKKAGMSDHRSMAAYMKAKGYIWSSESQNYILSKGKQNTRDNLETEFQSLKNFSSNTNLQEDDRSIDNKDIVDYNLASLSTSSSQLERLEGLIPMLEMINKNRDKLAELLSFNTSATIPRYVVGGITITKSLCMSHSLAELIKEFSKEKNISQREIFEVAIIEFFKKYGYEREINSLFSS
ncbi:hypothetical protein P8V03_15625 [Clostridium sp. A1-XYC3]|uniref:Uncharacterized protein n=1 Tax=Clostridium tanneri TaxID=3037988 RepID=A0ABU4JWQ1_9CLOT|nr:hypothetical protein [Clostridium sp. A1-XYC3]MDW8802577.1 hypothetical protein [Clostridium sp. A1-XYC3]